MSDGNEQDIGPEAAWEQRTPKLDLAAPRCQCAYGMTLSELIKCADRRPDSASNSERAGLELSSAD